MPPVLFAHAAVAMWSNSSSLICFLYHKISWVMSNQRKQARTKHLHLSASHSTYQEIAPLYCIPHFTLCPLQALQPHHLTREAMVLRTLLALLKLLCTSSGASTSLYLGSTYHAAFAISTVLICICMTKQWTSAAKKNTCDWPQFAISVIECLSLICVAFWLIKPLFSIRATYCPSWDTKLSIQPNLVSLFYFNVPLTGN